MAFNEIESKSFVILFFSSSFFYRFVTSIVVWQGVGAFDIDNEEMSAKVNDQTATSFVQEEKDDEDVSLTTEESSRGEEQRSSRDCDKKAHHKKNSKHDDDELYSNKTKERIVHQLV